MMEAVLFDLDGTLMDTSEGIFHTANYTVATLGLEPCHDEIWMRRFVGPPLKDCFRIVYGYQDEALLDRCVEVYRKEYEKVGMHLCHMYAGLEDVILHLRSSGVKTGVCTLKYEKLAKMIFDEKGMTGLFDTVRGTDEGGRLTKADCIRLAMDDLGSSVSGTLMVGDTVNDLDGARSVGVPFVGVSWGFGFEKGAQLEYGTLIDRCRDLVPLVEK